MEDPKSLVYIAHIAFSVLGLSMVEACGFWP